MLVTIVGVVRTRGRHANDNGRFFARRRRRTIIASRRSVTALRVSDGAKVLHEIFPARPVKEVEIALLGIIVIQLLDGLAMLLGGEQDVDALASLKNSTLAAERLSDL